MRLVRCLVLLLALGLPQAAWSFGEGTAAAAEAGASLFGTRELFSPDNSAFSKWTGMLERFAAERHRATRPCPPGIFEGCEPAEWRALVASLDGLDLRAKLDRVNAAINRHPYVPSLRNWNESNHWETPFEFLRKSGQCQDYAIAKYLLLRAAGVPAEKLRVVVLRDMRRGLDHAVMVAYVGGAALMLDNQLGEVVPTAAVGDYQPYYSINERGWWLHRGSNAATPRSTGAGAPGLGQIDEQQEAVRAQQRRGERDDAAQPEQRAGGRDDADRAEHDGDLEERTAVIEADVLALRMVARSLEAPRLGEQLLLAGARGGIALEALHRRPVIGDALGDRPAPLGGQIRPARQQRLERVGGEEVGGLALVARLIEGKDVGRQDVGVHRLLHGVLATQAGDGEQHAERTQEHRGEPAEAVVVARGAAMMQGLGDGLADLVGFQVASFLLSLPGEHAGPRSRVKRLPRVFAALQHPRERDRGSHSLLDLDHLDRLGSATR